MKQELNTLTRPAALAAAIAMAFSLAACNRAGDDRTAGQKVDAAVEQTRSATDNAKQEASTAATDIKNDTKAVANEASDKVADAAITASVNADLAKDSDLSALKINVDTNNGHVTLHGSAPSEEAKQRATKLASNVKGVTSVDNELSIQK
ncbi:BON domain-containing protein [Ideonella sp. BN130291]|uniref:BON domain-containing protein n=1 Tax=Ideonella sp. BN130291 TaxID=3112940 RepID=UPI002E26FB4B|nr:BON domain-containing protein [Ideonella sp. BN130291]